MLDVSLNLYAGFFAGMKGGASQIAMAGGKPIKSERVVEVAPEAQGAPFLNRKPCESQSWHSIDSVKAVGIDEPK